MGLKDGYRLRVPMQFRDSIADAPRLRFAVADTGCGTGNDD